MSNIKAVLWDVDNVWYPSTSTNYATMYVTKDVEKCIERDIANGCYAQKNVEAWKSYRIRKGLSPNINSVYELASQMYSDFYQEDDSTGECKKIFTKSEIIKRKQLLLKDLSMDQIKNVVENKVFLALNDGLCSAISEFRNVGLYQAAFSDGFSPIIYYLASKPETKVDYVWATPAYVKINGERTIFNPEFIECENIITLGEVSDGNNDKNPLAIAHMRERYNLNNVAAIDDSAHNIDGQLKIVQDSGGLAIGFYPIKSAYDKFEASGIPILNKNKPNLFPFIEIIKDPRKINEFCETWGKKF